MRSFAPLLAGCAALFLTPLSAQTKTLFYMNDTPASIRSFQANAAKIDLIAPAVYTVDAAGLVWGKPDGRVLDTARRFHVGVMPLIVNPGFKQDMIHALLTSADARRRMNASLLAECRKYAYYGIQFDFENVNYLDRELLTAMVAETSAALARGDFQLSIATVPNEGDEPGRGDYARWAFQNWRGAFDLGKLAPHVAFVSLMTYDQHTRNTPPGPVAGMPWVEKLIAYAESQMPKEKISLGVALYGRRWSAGMREKDPAVTASTIYATEAVELAKTMDTSVQWDPVEHAPWFYFYRNGIREYVFYNDARSFQDRYEMARQRGLHGTSAWILGSEDAELWQALPARKP
jgi:spore germination protein YaaH